MKSQNRYKGLTKKEYKRKHGSSTSGREKDRTRCQATELEKAIIKYPRAYKVFPILFKQITSKKRGKF